MAKKKKQEGLNDKQKMFCREFLRDFNGAQAAIRSGYSQKTARSIAHELLTKPDVQQYVQALAIQLNEKTDNQIERIVAELQLVAFGTIKDVAEWGSDGVYAKDSSLLREEARIIAEVSETSSERGGSRVKIKLHDKLKALELLGRYHKIFTDKVEHTGKDDTNLLAGIIGAINGSERSGDQG
jgi:phage terminase small subunit